MAECFLDQSREIILLNLDLKPDSLHIFSHDICSLLTNFIADRNIEGNDLVEIPACFFQQLLGFFRIIGIACLFLVVRVDTGQKAVDDFPLALQQLLHNQIPVDRISDSLSGLGILKHLGVIDQQGWFCRQAGLDRNIGHILHFLEILNRNQTDRHGVHLNLTGLQLGYQIGGRHDFHVNLIDFGSTLIIIRVC
ncbi:hypothetical protein D3C75_691870 [compost metagenome]